MLDGEQGALHFFAIQVLAVGYLRLKLCAEAVIVAVWHDTLLVEEGEHAAALVLDHLYALGVCLELKISVGPLDVLALVLLDF